MSAPEYTKVPLDQFQREFKDTSTEVSSVALGGRIVAFSDEFFAEATNLLKVEVSLLVSPTLTYDTLNARVSPRHLWPDSLVPKARSTMAGKLGDTTTQTTTGTYARPFPAASFHHVLFSQSFLHRVIVALGPSSSRITGFDIDTAHFTGNYGPEASVWGMKLETGDASALAKEEATLDGDDPRVGCFPSFFASSRLID